MTETKSPYHVCINNTLELPWPSSDLSPNARIDYHAKAKMVAAAKFEARILALANKMRIPADVPLVLTVVFSPPTRRHYDMDNLLSSIKAQVDGIFAACGADDHQIKRVRLDMDDVYPGGKVTVTVDVLSSNEPSERQKILLDHFGRHTEKLPYEETDKEKQLIAGLARKVEALK